MLSELEDYNWGEAFGFCGEEGAYEVRDPVSAIPGDSVFLTRFGREDVERITGIHAGVHDEEPWYCLGRLEDGRWFSLEAWCDYTGWD